MKYQLNGYNRNISEEELIKDLKSVSQKIDGRYLSRSLYEKNGRFSATPYIRRFGSWVSALEAANLSTQMPSESTKRISDIALLDDIRKVADIIDKEIITTRDYTQHGFYAIQTILSRFKTWNIALDKAGLPTKYKKVSDTDLFEEINRLWIEKGAPPTTTDIRNGQSLYSLNTFSRHFGGFRKALEAFVKYMEHEGIAITDDLKNESDAVNCGQSKKQKNVIIKHKTSREVNTTLRYKVLKRDNFKCCVCGASPAKDSHIELHIDHIIPWSKGGETTIDNLQTLCSKCNLGKKDDI